MKKTVFITPRHLALAEKLIKDGFYLNFDDVIAAVFRLLAKEHPGCDQNPLPIKIETESSDDVIFLETKQTTQLPESSNHPPAIVEFPKAVDSPPSTFFEPDSTGKKDKAVKKRRNFQNKFSMYTGAVPTGCVDIRKLKCPARKYSHIPFFVLALKILGPILKRDAQRRLTATNLFLSIIDFPTSTPSYTQENFQQQFKKNIINKLESIKNIQEWHELTAWRDMKILFAVTRLALHYAPNASYLRDYHQRLTYIKKFNWQFVFFDAAVTPRFRVATPDYALNINRNVEPPVVTVEPLFNSSTLQTIAEDQNEPNEFKVNTQPETDIPAPLDALITQSFPITTKGQKRRYKEINSLSPNREVEDLPPTSLSSDPLTPPHPLFFNFPTGPAKPGTLPTPMSLNSFLLFSPTQIPLPHAADEQEKTPTEPIVLGSDPLKSVGR